MSESNTTAELQMSESLDANSVPAAAAQADKRAARRAAYQGPLLLLALAGISFAGAMGWESRDQWKEVVLGPSASAGKCSGKSACLSNGGVPGVCSSSPCSASLSSTTTEKSPCCLYLDRAAVFNRPGCNAGPGCETSPAQVASRAETTEVADQIPTGTEPTFDESL